MSRMRYAMLAVSVTAAALVLPLTSAAQATGARGGYAPPPARIVHPAGPAVPAILGDDATLDGVWCTSKTFCAAVGFFFARPEGGFWFGLSENWDGHGWGTDTVPGQQPRDFVTWPLAVSCSAADTCVLVGEHYQTASAPAMVAESLSGGTWNITQWSDPSGAKMGWLGDVSCLGPAFCLAVGAYSKSTFAHEHMFAERWTGSRWVHLNTPAPAGSRWSELGGLSCVSATDCVGVGDFKNAAGHVLSFADVWNGHQWSLTKTPNVRGKKQSIFNAVSCAGATTCMAVGFATGPGERQFAEKWTGGRWQLTTLPNRANSALLGVSCPATSFCMASGFSGQAALTEERIGGTWRALRTPSPVGTRRAASLEHVSCVSQTHCVAVGFRYNPKIGASNHTLAEVWDGHGWRIQTTVNP